DRSISPATYAGPSPTPQFLLSLPPAQQQLSPARFLATPTQTTQVPTYVVPPFFHPRLQTQFLHRQINRLLCARWIRQPTSRKIFRSPALPAHLREDLFHQRVHVLAHRRMLPKKDVATYSSCD